MRRLPVAAVLLLILAPSAHAKGTADPNAWLKSTETEEIRYAPGLIDKRIEFTNRPTFQQAISFRGGRPE